MTPDTLTVSVSKTAELEADCADLTVVIEGAQPFSGQQAFKKAREVQSLVVALTESGVDQAQVKLRSVQMSSGSFAMIRSSSARYGLSIMAVRMDILPRAISAIASQKGAKLTELNWRYETREVVRRRLRKDALQEALQLAHEEAALVGVSLLAIHKTDEEINSRAFGNFFGDADITFSETSNDITAVTELGGTTEMFFRLQVTFRIGPLPAEQPDLKGAPR
jgi:hypothetical protein